MSKITQNAVLVLLATGAQVFQKFTKGADNKRVVTFLDGTGNAVPADQVTRLNIGDTGESVVNFLKKFNALPAQPRSGYDKYVNDEGFVNPKSPESFSPQGIGKTIAKSLEVAFSIIGRGGSDATEMQAVLNGIAQYQELAPKIVAERQKAAQMATALAALGDSPEAAALRKMASDQGIELPPLASVVPPADIEPNSAVDTDTADDADDDGDGETADEDEEATAKA